MGRGQYYFLNELLFVGDGITYTELSEKLSVDKAATTRAVHKPEQSGPVTVVPHPKDRRSRIIYMTEKGKELREEYHEIFRQLNREMTAGLTPSEEEFLRRGIFKMWNTLKGEAVNPEEPDGVIFRPIGNIYRKISLMGSDERDLGYVILKPEMLPGMEELHVGDKITLVFHFHKGRSALHVLKRGTGPRTSVFATGSPWRPNGIGITSVEIVKKVPEGLWVRGADMMTGTPIPDIKPYVE